MTRLLSFTVLALVLAACDAASPDDAALTTADLDDAAAVVASALAVDAGGLLEDAAAGASLAAPASADAWHPGPRRPGCDADRTYSEADALWTVALDCERGQPDGRFYASFERLTAYRFLGADGQPQPERDGAASVEVDVLSGASQFRSPRGTHALRSLTARLTVSDLDAELVTVDGTVQRSAADTLRGARGVRTLDYDLDATLDGVRGPRAVSRRWRTAVEGTVTGTLRATLTRTPRGGETTTVEVDEAFTVTFPIVGGGDRVAEIALGGRRYRADVETGEVDGLDG